VAADVVVSADNWRRVARQIAAFSILYGRALLATRRIQREGERERGSGLSMHDVRGKIIARTSTSGSIDRLLARSLARTGQEGFQEPVLAFASRSLREVRVSPLG